MGLSNTSKITMRKLSLVNVVENGPAFKETVKGLEWGSSISWSSYVLSLAKHYLKTTPVSELKEIHNTLMFRTANSLYRIEYTKGGLVR